MPGTSPVPFRAPVPTTRRARWRRHATGLLAVAAVLVLLPAVPSSAAPAPDPVAQARAAVEAAERDVAAMQAEVERTAAVLTEGTRRLEAGQAELARTQAEQDAAARAADAAVARAAQAKARLGVVVAATLRSPVPDSMKLALTAGPDDIRDAVVARADLDRVRGSSQDLLREATASRVQADQLVRTAEQLTTRAAEQERALAADVERLGQVARDAEGRLTRAADALAGARAVERATRDRVAAEAAEAAAQAAREAALAAAAAARSSAVVATCGGAPAGQQANGFLDPSVLCPLDDAPGHALRADAAAAFNALNAAHKAERGSPLCVTDSYRSYGEQVDVYARKPALAAVPGRSNHGWGLAVDFGCGVERFGSDAHEWMRSAAGRFGWFHPAWAQAGGSRPEAWHWEFSG